VKVKDSRAIREPADATLRCATSGLGLPMAGSVESLFVAFFIAIAPEPDAAPAALWVAGLEAEPQALPDKPKAQPERPKAQQPRDPEACRYYVDPEARRKCAIRADRAASGAAEPSFPEGTYWLTPEEPRMPSRLPPNRQR